MDKRIQIGIGIIIVIILFVLAYNGISTYQSFNYENHDFDGNFTMDIPESYNFIKIVNNKNLVSYEANKIIVTYYDLTNRTERAYCDSNMKTLSKNPTSHDGNITIYKEGRFLPFYNCVVYSDDNKSCVRVQSQNQNACLKMAKSVKFLDK